jgi:protein-disulfide isomerase
VAERRRTLVVVAVVAAVVLAGGLVAVSVLASRDDDPDVSSDVVLPGAEVVQESLAGVAQDGAFLGPADAPSVLVEYAVIQCPVCAEWSVRTLPTVIDRYVRTGQVRLEFRPLAFIGEDSEKAARAALAAGLQDRLWNVVELLYVNQGGENTGWVSDELLAALGPSIPGLDVEQMLGDMDAEAVDEGLAEAQAAADRDGVEGTPTFLAGPAGGPLRELELTSLEPEPFAEALDAALDG